MIKKTEPCRFEHDFKRLGAAANDKVIYQCTRCPCWVENELDKQYELDIGSYLHEHKQNKYISLPRKNRISRLFNSTVALIAFLFGIAFGMGIMVY